MTTARFRTAILAATLSMATGTATLSAQQVIAPETSARAELERAIERGAYGELELETREGTVHLHVDGEALHDPHMIRLVEPGTRVRLDAELETPPAGAMPPRTLRDTGVFRQTFSSEVLWEAEPDDLLEPQPGGGVLWQPGSATGRPSYAAASVAILRVDRPARLVASPDSPAPAVLDAGRAGVLLLPGVLFDRNGDGILHGQNIGIYPNEQGSSAPESVSSRARLYAPPRVFYRIDQRTGAARITPHLTLGELAPPMFPEDAAGPRFAAVSPRLVTFLHAFESKLAEQGFDPAKLVILRGFVSPTDRRRLERQGVNLAEFTRFQYGDALAVVLDPSIEAANKWNAPPIMGDLDGDGRTTVADAEKLAAIVKDTMDEVGMFGGLGVIRQYEGPGASKGTPCVQFDLRGWYAPF